MSNQTAPLDGAPMAARLRNSRHGRPPLRLLPTAIPGPSTAEELERAALAFDPQDDLAQIIPMPPTIPRLIRAAITQALGDRFEYAEELDEWLHGPNDSLAGATPFERVVVGDGMAVLVALLGPGDHQELHGLGPTAGPWTRSSLDLVR